MNIKDVLSQMITTLETQEALAPIETAVERMEAELTRVTDEVEALQEKGDVLRNAEAQAKVILEQAEFQKKAADFHYQEQVRKGEEVVANARSKAAKILRETYDNRDQLQAENHNLNAQRTEIRNEIYELEKRREEMQNEIPKVQEELKKYRIALAEAKQQDRINV